jgi:hypothetical protein
MEILNFSTGRYMVKWGKSMGCWGGRKIPVVLDEVDIVDSGEGGHS